MIQKLAFAVLLLVSVSQAAWDLFPVPSGTGGSFRLRNTVNYGETGVFSELMLDDIETIYGDHSLEGRFYTHNIEIGMQFTGAHWDERGDNGALDMVLMVRYQILRFLSVFVDMDAFSWQTLNMNQHYLKAGVQFAGSPVKKLFLGSEIGVKNPFKTELSGHHFTSEHFEIPAENEIKSFNQGAILNIAFEVDYVTGRVIWFIGADAEMLLDNTDINTVKKRKRNLRDFYGNYYYETTYEDYHISSDEDLFQINLGASYAINKHFSIELDNFARFGRLRTTDFGHALNLKFNIP